MRTIIEYTGKGLAILAFALTISCGGPDIQQRNNDEDRDDRNLIRQDQDSVSRAIDDNKGTSLDTLK